MKLIVLALIFQFVISCWPKTNIVVLFCMFQRTLVKSRCNMLPRRILKCLVLKDYGPLLRSGQAFQTTPNVISSVPLIHRRTDSRSPDTILCVFERRRAHIWPSQAFHENQILLKTFRIIHMTIWI